MEIIRTTADAHFAPETDIYRLPYGGVEMVYKKLLAYAKDGGPASIDP
jgi:hypothetical protein